MCKADVIILNRRLREGDIFSKDLREVRKQIMQTLGQEQSVQRPWGRSILSIFEEEQRGQSGWNRRVGGLGKAIRGRALWPTVMPVASAGEKGKHWRILNRGVI